MKHVAFALSIAAIVPSCPPAHAALNVCDCDPGYNDPGDTFTALPVPLLKWSGLILPDVPLVPVGGVLFQVEVGGVLIYSASIDFTALTLHGGKWQYDDQHAHAGGLRWVELAPHSGGWRIAWQAYDDGFAFISTETRIVVTVNGHCYLFDTLWKERKGSPKGWHMLGLK